MKKYNTFYNVNFQELINQYESNKIKKVYFTLAEVYYGAYQLKDGFTSIKEASNWIDESNFEDLGWDLSGNFDENKPVFEGSFTFGLKQELDITWFFNKIKEIAAYYFKEKQVSAEELTMDEIYMIFEEFDIHVDESGLVGNGVEFGIVGEEFFVGSDWGRTIFEIFQNFEEDISASVCSETRDQSYDFVFETE